MSTARTRESSSGTVSGKSRVGGLVGSNDGSASQCYSTGAVSGVSSVGGLVGFNAHGDVNQCYSTGPVSGTGLKVGGLAGDNRGRIITSFWDTQTSGQTMSAGGSGRTTAKMQIQSTFTEAGWDFVSETQNGTEDIWAICEGGDYPHLAWEFVIGDFDADADTDFADFCILAEHWLAADSSFWCGAGGTDLTNDGKVDFDDFRYLTDNWLTGAGP